ncbi:MAG TPA: methyltransferase domain-containing protein [Anaerolineales bacterium]|nr:methyltransferase domain-containing protein [Anaerolineales bacterium]
MEAEDPKGLWNPAQYLKFSDERLRPALELLQRIPPRSPELIYDLGCGTGHITRIISERWDTAVVYGLDNSDEMLEAARSQPGRVRWIHTDIRTWVPPSPPDLIYSNAALHWVEDHAALFPRFLGFLKPGGCLAVQMPLSYDLPSHRLMRETLAGGGPESRRLGSEVLREDVGRRWVEETQTYYHLLSGIASTIDIWETEYLQILEGADAVLEWVRGTGLRPILDGLAPAELEIFLTEYRRRLQEAYPPQRDGRTLYPFRRLFIVAVV